MALPVILILLCILGYSLVIFWLASGLPRGEVSREEAGVQDLKVSVILPFRNEEQNLPFLVQDLLDQSYPKSNYEVVFVDDHSEDGSRKWLESRISGLSGFSCLKLPQGCAGKKSALYHGIQAATHDRLIQMDADCRISRHFIASHMAFIQNHPSDLVAGLLSTSNGKGGFLEGYERLDLLALAGTGAGSFGKGKPMMCSGANLSYTRDLYMETRKFDPAEKTESGDDMFLMIGARKLKRPMAFNTAIQAVVETAPVKSFRALLKQRIRWGAKSIHYGMPDIQGLALLVLLCHMSILLMPLWFFLYNELWPWMAGAWLMKSLADLFLLYRTAGLCRQRDALIWFAPVSLVYYPVFFMSLAGALMGKSRWKRDA